jgi:hypothetical protein
MYVRKRGESIMAVHTVPVVISEQTYRELKCYYAEMSVRKTLNIGHLSGPSAVLSEAIYHILGEESHPENPIIKKFLLTI